MDKKHAQFILESYRSGEQDATDLQFAEALDFVACDAELATWFAEERALDDVIGRKLKEFPAPLELREALLVARPPALRPARPISITLGLAAALAFLAVATALWFKPDHETARFAAFRQDMLATVSRVVTLSFVHEDIGEIQKWLANEGSVTGYELPTGLQRLPGRGCRTLTWNGQSVALICFRLEDNQTLHLFVAPRGALPDPPGGEPAQLGRHQKWVTASWSKGDKVYVMASLGDEASLRPYL